MVIGILAAISIVAYNGISNNANDAAVQNDLTNFAKQLEVYRAETGSYPSSAQIIAGVIKVKPSKASYSASTFANRNFGYCLTTAPSTNERFALWAMSKSGAWYSYESNGGLKLQKTEPWKTGGSAACPYFGFSTTEPGYGHHWLRTNDHGDTNGYWAVWLQ